jgi:hypothetical protein
MFDIKTAKEILAVTHKENRLWVLKKLLQSINTERLCLYGYCNKIGATADELGKLLLDRAAQRGMRPESDLIR